MAQSSMKSTYDEPTIMWRLRCETGGAHAVIVPNGSRASAVWFAGGQAQESRDFDTWKDAVHWIYLELARLLLDGWEVEELEG